MTFFDFIRDTTAWKAIRLVTGGRIPQFQYYDERHPMVRDKYASDENVWRTPREQVLGAKDSYMGRTPVLKRNNTSEHRSSQPTRDPYQRGYSFDGRRFNSHWSSESIDSTPAEKYLSESPSRSSKGFHLVQFFPDDPENPRNWSGFKKACTSFQICLLIATTYAAASIYTVGTTGVRLRFGVSDVVALLGLTAFVIGYGVGPMVWGPLSETPKIGRNSIFIPALIVFIVAQIPIALATNFEMLLAFRFIAGFFGAPVLGTGGGILVDLYAPRKQTYAMVLWALIGVAGPTIGPIIGGFAVEAKGWQWSIWIVAWMGTSTLTIMVFFLPETSADNILYRRALRLRRATGDRRYTCEAQIKAEDTTGKELLLAHLVRPFTLLITEPSVFFLVLYSSFTYGLMYIWFESLPLAYAEVYHFTLGTQSLALLGLIAGVLIIIPPFFLYYRFRIEPNFNRMGNIEPERLLIPAMMGCLLPPASLVWFGFTARPSTNFLIPIVGSSLFSAGALMLFISFLNYLGESYPDHISSIFASHELFTSLCGATFPLFVPSMFFKFDVLGSSILLAIFAVAFAPIPFVLYMNGDKLRNRSSYASKKM